ncbi:MAG TPA: DUF262 domain-containing protein, partial [Myxococcota bacterium]|nr:DUF262 domain-containing protein [Myxococcota bacterium]
MEAGKRIITDIFNRARVLEIPFFQRQYVWSREDWERLLEDLEATAQSKSPYFMGSIILKQRTTDSGSPVGDVRVVVDGQQRMTTLALFFRVLCDTHGLLEMFKSTFTTFKGQFILQHNHADREVFEACLKGEISTEFRAQHPNHKVLQAFDYFSSQAERLGKIDPVSMFQLVYFVGIDLAVEEDEQQIFDTINSLGVALTTAELLKNELFGRNDLALYNQTWREVFDKDDATRDYWKVSVTSGRTYRQMVDLFLQSFLIAQDGVGDDLRIEKLFEEYKKHLKARVPERTPFIHDLTRSARVFRDHMKRGVVKEGLDAASATERLNLIVFGLNTTTIVPYALFLLRTQSDEAERDKM